MARWNTQAKNGMWKGGRTIASSGYVLIRVGKGHPRADSRGYAYEHRLVAEEALGRPLKPGEQVHHKNGDKLDNRPENLEVEPSIRAHRFQHRAPASRLQKPGEPNPLVACLCGCGAFLTAFDGSGRPRRFLSGHNLRRGVPRG